LYILLIVFAVVVVDPCLVVVVVAVAILQKRQYLSHKENLAPAQLHIWTAMIMPSFSKFFHYLGIKKLRNQGISGPHSTVGLSLHAPCVRTAVGKDR